MAPIITVTTQPLDDPRTATLTHYQQVAGDLIAALDAFVTVFPKLAESEVADAKQVRRNLNVPDVFCYTAINAVELLPEVDSLKKQYAETGRNRLQYLEGGRTVYAKLVAVAGTVLHGLRANKSAVAGDALDIYRVVSAQRKNSRNPALFAFYADMKAALGRKLPTKAERDLQKQKKFNEAVEQVVQQRMQAFFAEQKREVNAA